MVAICLSCGAAVRAEGTAVSTCPRCGSRVSVPPPGVALPTPTFTAENDDHVGFDPQQLQTPPQISEVRPPSGAKGIHRTHAPAPRPNRGRSLLIGGGAVVLAIAAVLLAFPLRHPLARVAPAPVNPRADGMHAADVARWQTRRAAADTLALTGHWQEAYTAYDQLLQDLAYADVNDPALRDLATSTRAAQDQVFRLLLRQRETSATPPVAPSPTVATALPVDAAPLPRITAIAARPAPSLQSPPRPAVPSAAAVTTTAPLADGVPPLQDRSLPPRPPLAFRTYNLPDDITDAQVAAALHKGAMFLQRAFRNGQLQTYGSSFATNDYHGALSLPGIDALCVYALLHAGQTVNEPWLAPEAPFTQQMLAVLKSYRLDHTYHRSLRAAALAVYNRSEDYASLEDDTRWLVQASSTGAYTYTAAPVLPNGTNGLPPGLGTSSTSGGTPGIAFPGGTSSPHTQLFPWTWKTLAYEPVTVGHFAVSGSAPPPAQHLPAVPGGAMMYGPTWDNSNSQYGLLGVWSGAEAGVAVPVAYWEQVQQHWLDCQLPSSAWGYLANDAPRLSMTDAGLASLLVTSDYLDRSGLRSPAAQRAIQRALDVLDQGDNATATVGANNWFSYTLYGLERVGLASGFKFFGKHDWYAEFAKQLVASQQDDGSWGPSRPATEETAIDTAFSMLFLARGRHPVLYNKLRFDGDWNDYPHDIANLTRFASYELQRPLNWQVINTASDWPTWMDSPVLYIASDEAPQFTPADLSQLRSYALAGGLIFSHADNSSSETNAWAARLAKQLFPDDALVRLPSDHPLFSTLYNLKKPLPDLLGLGNGSRLLMVHSPYDMAQYWQHQWTDAGKAHYQLAVNLFIYANGKTQLHNRLESTYIPPYPGVTQDPVPVARLSYPGAWDPEPYAWTRFRNYFQWETHRDLTVQPVELPNLQPGQAAIAVLTGTAAQPFSDEDVQAVRKYVESGGILLIDACGGSPGFATSVRQSLLGKAFPTATLQPLGGTHPALLPTRPEADDLTTPLFRPYAKDLAHGQDPPPLQFLTAGKGQVIFSPLDVTTGLLGTNTFGINGYDPLYAAALVKNLVLWADEAVPVPSSATTQPVSP